ncbi:MAG TPA: LamG-like jellyroll fold domain-containing protein, partial [Cellulomonas sp.]|nr:LamG-like jellyroll fold domain-containing protein [Cellulomonas sp.]
MLTTLRAGAPAGTRRARWRTAGTASLAALGLVAMGLPAHAASPTVVPAADPVSVPTPLVAYTFDDAAPGVTTVHNSGSGGSAYDGAVVNASKLLTGTRGGAATLALPGGPQGSTDTDMPYVTIPNGVYSGAQAVTVATWVYWDGKNVTSAAAPWAFILGGDKLANNNYGVFFAPSNGSKLAALANDGPEYSASNQSPLPVNTWTHVAITEDGSQLVLYVNGLATDRVTSP